MSSKVYYYRSKQNHKLYCAQHARSGMEPVTTNVYPEECCRCLDNRLKLMKRYRETVCAGCHNNRYNYKSDGDVRNAPTAGTGCFNLIHIKRNTCKLRRNPY